MAVYDGVPSIRLEGDEGRALALVPEAKALLYKVQTFKQRAGVGTFSMSRRVDDDSTIYVLSTQDQNLIHIAVAPDIPEQINSSEANAPAKLAPDIYSGLVYNGFLRSNGTRSALDSFVPTPTCLRTHPELLAGRQEVVRLAVAPYFDELKNSGLGPAYSQYTKLRPSMYSGTMRKVVQVLMGLGRIGKAKLRDPDRPHVTPAYLEDVATNGVQIRFDWRFIRTHGIVVAADGRLWVVEISAARGAVAVPLPLVPKTDTAAFRAKVQAKEDWALLRAIEELGGLPSGEGVPATAARLSQMLENGTALRLLSPEDVAPFYEHSAYSSALGWAFNSSGSEAHNTAYRFGDDGFQRGVWYQISLSIGATKLVREPGEPLAEHSGQIKKMGEGYLYAPPAPGTSYARYLPIKFHEPMLPGLLSHEGVPLAIASGLPQPKCDTTVFVGFVDDEFHAVRFYRNPNNGEHNTLDDPRYPGECLLNGTWVITQTTGTRGIPAMMYSNTIDGRRAVQETVHQTTMESRDLGYDPPRFSDFIESPDTAYVWRERVFQQTTTTDIRVGETLASVVAIPEYSREAYYYAEGSGYASGRTLVTNVGYTRIRDPNVGYAWRCFPSANLPPWPSNIGCDKRNCGGNCSFFPGGPRTHKERRVVCLNYEPDGSGCHDFADSGNWLGVCDVVDGFNSPAPARANTNTFEDKGGDYKASLQLVTHGYGGPLRLPLSWHNFSSHWQTPSPDPKSGTVQYILATHSAIGDDGLVYCTDLLAQGGFSVYGYTPDLVGEREIPCFVGVNIQ